MTDAYTKLKEWPKMLYRPADKGGVEKRIFNSEAEIPEGQGWTDSASAKAKAKPAPVVETIDSKQKRSLMVQLEQASKDNAELTNMLAKAEAAHHDALRVNGEKDARISDLEAFLDKIIASDAPANVRTEAQSVRHPPPPPEAEPKRRPIKRKGED